MTIDSPHVIKTYEDVYFVYKPAGWNCTTDNEYTKLELQKQPNLILTWIKNNLKKDEDVDTLKTGFGLLNRLDLETSGIIMVAKNLKSYQKYRQSINEHLKTTKIYLCLVEDIVEHEFGIIELPLYYDKQKRVTSVNDSKGKFSYTEYIKLKTFSYKDKKYTLLLVKIKTGRTHQIRVHLKSIGHTIVCDKKYKQNKNVLRDECELTKRLFLHSYYYKIENDVDGYAFVPKELNNALEKLQLIKVHIEYQNALDILKSNIITNKFLNDHVTEVE
jgi:23S rRNA-/tRNA-specific pseudouridylate synthase